jgi:hypothetical protein
MGFDMVPHQFTFLFQSQAFLLTFFSGDPNILLHFMFCQQNHEILSGDGQNKFVSRARGDFSSLQIFQILTLAADLFRSAAKLVQRIPSLSFF